MESYVVKIRRQLHMYPEIGFDLDRTLATLRAELDGIGVEYTEKFGKSSIVATVNPEKTAFTIGVRADMDALPIREENDVPYKSCIDGQMHACGHDAHTAIALATLRRVYEMRNELDCRVKFLFQPAEEFTTSGAKLMAQDGVMEDIDCIVALHCDTTFSVGTVAITEGPQNANSDGFMLDFFGKSAHAANQEKGIDANVMAMRAFMDIELAVAKEIAARSPVIFNVGAIHSGVTNNIIADHCSMFCTLRTWTDDTREYMLDKIKRICAAVAETAGGSYTYTTKKYYPIVHNDPKVTEMLRRAAIGTLGEENVLKNNRALGGEDFSYFANQKPGAFLRLGVRPADKDKIPGAHNSHFDIDESALEIGVNLFLQFIRDNQHGF